MKERRSKETKAHHKAQWLKIVSQIRAERAAHENDLMGLVDIVAQTEREEPGGLKKRDAQLFNLRLDDAGDPMQWICAVDGRYTLVEAGREDTTLVDAVLERITPNTDYVVELGSGWGRNLFNVYRGCAREDLRYVACELTKGGRRATELLCALEPGIPFSVKPFDHLAPDLSWLQDKPNVVFFTCHSLEWVTRLDSKLFDLMLDRTDICTCIHAEPVGWQRFPPLTEEVECAWNGQPQRRRLNFSYVQENFHLNAALRSCLLRFNVNLLRALDAMEAKGAIKITQRKWDFWGANPFIPASLLVWEKA